MKKVFIITLVVATCLFSLGSVAMAAGYSPMGGMVTVTKVAGVTCTRGTGPVTIQSSGGWPKQSYLFLLSSPTKYGSITEKAMSLGLYSRVLDETSCYEGECPECTPYPVYTIKLYGATLK